MDPNNPSVMKLFIFVFTCFTLITCYQNIVICYYLGLSIINMTKLLQFVDGLTYVYIFLKTCLEFCGKMVVPIGFIKSFLKVRSFSFELVQSMFVYNLISGVFQLLSIAYTPIWELVIFPVARNIMGTNSLVTLQPDVQASQNSQPTIQTDTPPSDTILE